jgi:hypothetical protein
MGQIYLLHFDKPLKHARHYLGFAEESVAQRVSKHRKGQGARLTQVVAEAGIDMQLSRIWPDADRNFERRLKNGKNVPKLCPICVVGAEPMDESKIF